MNLLQKVNVYFNLIQKHAQNMREPNYPALTDALKQINEGIQNYTNDVGNVPQRAMLMYDKMLHGNSLAYSKSKSPYGFAECIDFANEFQNIFYSKKDSEISSGYEKHLYKPIARYKALLEEGVRYHSPNNFPAVEPSTQPVEEIGSSTVTQSPIAAKTPPGSSGAASNDVTSYVNQLVSTVELFARRLGKSSVLGQSEQRSATLRQLDQNTLAELLRIYKKYASKDEALKQKITNAFKLAGDTFSADVLDLKNYAAFHQLNT